MHYDCDVKDVLCYVFVSWRMKKRALSRGKGRLVQGCYNSPREKAVSI